MLRMLKHSAWIPRPAVAGAVAAARRDAERTRPRVRLLDAPNSSTNSFVNNERPKGTRQRIEKVDSGGTTDSLFDGSRVLADSRADYPNGGITGLISERAGSTTLTYHGDQLGSTRGLSNSSEALTTTRERDAWGNVVSSSGTLASPFGFVGGEGYQQDPDSGLMLLGARYYDPSVGRFISRDPIRYGGGDVNLYRYCGNVPMDVSDPSGTIAPLVIIGICIWLIVITEQPADPPPAGYKHVSIQDEVDDWWDSNVGLGKGYSPPTPVLASTQPTLPPSMIFRLGEVRIEHYYHGNDHGPAHAHVSGGGPDTKIGPQGYPVDGHPEPTREQLRAINARRSRIRHALNGIGRYLKFIERLARVVPK